MKEYGTLILNKKGFIEIIEALKEQFIHDRKCNEAFKTILPNDFISGYDISHLWETSLALVKTATNDNHRDSWIEYFIYELDFGRKFRMGMVKDVDGKDADLSNPEKLWDFLEKYSSES